jgi:hypothetical protein
MVCINIKHPEFRALVSEFESVPEPLMTAYVTLWMQQNTDTRFPTESELKALISTKNSKIFLQKNPFKELGKKYNMNTSGFMPPNVDLAQVQRDAARLGLSVARANSGSWYLKDSRGKKINPFSQKQLESKEKELPEKILTEQLYKWATKHGIEITTMDDLIARHSENKDFYSGAAGVADLLNKIIALDPESEKIDTLAEEIAHFATTILKNNPSVKKALEKIVETKVYQTVKNEYTDEYTEEEDFRKEALDKLLAETIVEKFKETEENKGILPYLKAIFNKLFKWIKGVPSDAKEEIKNELMPLAESILSGEYLGEFETTTNETIIFKQKKKRKLEVIVNEIQKNKDFIKLSEDGTHYINTKTGQKYTRVTDYISDETLDENEYLISSNIIGTKVDELVRDFFADNLKELSEYNVASKAIVEDFLQALQEIKDNFDARGETVLANDIVLYNDKLGVAGTVDLLTYDEDGVFRIYDMKTMRGDNFSINIQPVNGETVSKYDFKGYYDEASKRFVEDKTYDSKREKHQKQLSLYRILLNNTHGVTAKTLGILPIEVWYEAGQTKTSRLGLLEGVKINPLSTLKDATLLDDTVEVEVSKKSISKPKSKKSEVSSKKKKFIEKTIEELENRLASLINANMSKKPGSIASLERTIVKLKAQLSINQADLAIQSIIELANEEFDKIQVVIEKAQETGKINANTSVLIRSFSEMYRKLFDDFTTTMEYWGFPKEEADAIRQSFREIRLKINQIDEINDGLSIRILEEMGIEEELLEDGVEDLNWWRVTMGNFKYAKTKFIRQIFEILYSAKLRVKRHAFNVADELLALQSAMEKEGYKVEDLIDKDSKGNYTQYLIRERDWAYYFEQRERVKEELAQTLGVANYNEIDFQLLPSNQKKIVEETWKKFRTQYQETIKDEDGAIMRVPKKRNEKFQELMKNKAVKLYYDALKYHIKQSIEKLPVQYRTPHRYYQLPGIRPQLIERFFKSNTDFKSNITQSLREIISKDEDDTQFGSDLNVLNNRMVPIYFMHKIKEGNFSRDLTRSITIFSEMAENFREMNKISGQMQTTLHHLGQRDYVKEKIDPKTGKKVTQKIKDGNQSYDYKALQTLSDALVYGIQKDDVNIKLGKKKISVTKFMQNFAGFIRTNNLALNAVTSIAGSIKGGIDSIIEDQIGLYTTVESKNFARLEIAKQTPHVLAELHKKKQTSKIQLLLQMNNVIELGKVLKNTNMNSISRKIFDRNLLFINYQVADYGLKGRSMIAIMDNFRLYNGKFINKKQFIDLKERAGADYGGIGPAGATVNRGKNRGEINKEWSSLREQSLYNAYEVVDGKLEVKDEFKEYVTEGLLNKVTGTIEHVTRQIDGTLSDTDKGALARSAYGDLVLMHRGWLINMLDTRLMKEIENPLTGEKEIGSYNAMYRKFLYDNFLMGGNNEFKLSNLRLSGAIAGWSKLEPHEKRGVIKATLDLVYLNIVAFLAAFANLAADDADDDDWTSQYFAYQMNRILLEQSAAWNPKELVQIIDEPVVGTRMIKDLLDISEMWSTEKFEGGMYKDWTHASKWWFKKLPTKNLYELQFPEMKNRFIKQIVDSKTYNALKDGEISFGSNTSTLDRIKMIISDENTIDEDRLINLIELDEEYLNE